MTELKSPLSAVVDELWERRAELSPVDSAARAEIVAAVDQIDAGEARVAFVDAETDEVVVDERAKRAILLAFKQNFAGIWGSCALVILMLPLTIRSAEEMLKLVPHALREASYALGIPKWRTITRVVVPTALPGIVTGVMLAIARVMGETAPVLLVVGSALSMNSNPFSGRQETLPVFIYDGTTNNDVYLQQRAWAAALTLILLIMILNLFARLIAWWKKAGQQ